MGSSMARDVSDSDQSEINNDLSNLVLLADIPARNVEVPGSVYGAAIFMPLLVETYDPFTWFSWAGYLFFAAYEHRGAGISNLQCV